MKLWINVDRELNRVSIDEMPQVLGFKRGTVIGGQLEAS